MLCYSGCSISHLAISLLLSTLRALAKTWWRLDFRCCQLLTQTSDTISNEQAEGRWMFTGGEDCTARIWDLKMRNLSCQVYSPMDRKETSTFLSLANLPSQRTSDLRLPPPQPARDGRRGPVRSNSHLEFTGQTLLLSYAGDISWILQNDQSEPIIPDPKASIQHVAIDPKGHHMAAVNNKVLDKKLFCGIIGPTLIHFQGHCYVWALSSGEPKESSKLVPKNKILAHEGRWALSWNKVKPIFVQVQMR